MIRTHNLAVVTDEVLYEPMKIIALTRFLTRTLSEGIRKSILVRVILL